MASGVLLEPILRLRLMNNPFGLRNEYDGSASSVD